MHFITVVESGARHGIPHTAMTLNLCGQVLWNAYTRKILFLVQTLKITLDDVHTHLMTDDTGAHIHGVAHVVMDLSLTLALTLY